MAVYKLGSSGDEVLRLQRKLAELGVYAGPVDGQFGGGTFAAVTKYQREVGLEADGIVGALTWQRLFSEEIRPPVRVTDSDLGRRCLALTGSFETGAGEPECFCGLSGDFDGQGISFGVLQWNFGQGSLQPLLADMFTQHPNVLGDIFGGHLEALKLALDSDKDELMAFARSVQHPVKHTVHEPWRGFAKSLGRTPEFQAIQTRHAGKRLDAAAALCREFGLTSERALALMFDIVVQNGSISAIVKAQIRADERNLGPGLAPDRRELALMEIVANRRAQAANPRWVDDVRSRKLCIARGEGTVHGIPYDLESQFGIGLRDAVR
ncbi:peptidoglycan-binding protein [Aquincola sp. S2]|uniref:Peptidoglycan-binding protein n=1 Tax=Pseudaquabacterium terrae TaxID=2732868 RepID=A0ABX2ECS5_9BURK|nr:peptidoglycan-binding domain-containing protein [Aquabacterium terrae]NRF65665.1 peptidoglycan-binding protein [Aquabacterium terrae]